MHEFSLAQGLHGQLLDLAREHGVEKILKAEVRIGSNAGVVEESFVFGFNVVAGQDPKTTGMELIISRDEGRDLILMQVQLQ
ncbi:MAG: hydrogenase maturation nickel metallochaperone HypA [Desulfoprunum sp.]|nr:hydrogenase maturation nickel metallochaperone HypA [Desulfoprunum sp.]